MAIINKMHITAQPQVISYLKITLISRTMKMLGIGLINVWIIMSTQTLTITIPRIQHLYFADLQMVE